LLFLTINSNFLIAQYCTVDDRFTEVEFFASNEISGTENLTYATDVLDWNGNLQDLEMDVYYPSAESETLSSRPFVLLLHGGGFQNGNKNLMEDYCIGLAQRGFVAATMNYRLGWDTSVPTEQVKAGYRVQQDANAALRYIVEHAASYDIDTDWMFIGGQSAGSIASLFTVYVDQAEWDVNFPGIEAELGSLYTSGNIYTHTFDLQGVFNNWGMTFELSPDPSELVPTISFHGALDGIVPIGNSSIEHIDFIGSNLIHEVLLDNGVCSELMVDPNGDHGILTNSAGLELRLGRASCFFKSVFCDDCNSELLTDPVAANCSPTILPIELLSFSAKQLGSRVHLNWETNHEIDNDFFSIEKSLNGFNFETIGRVEGSKNSIEIVAYEYVDAQVVQGNNYYRLKQTDLNGEYSYSKIISVLMTNDRSLKIYPNPVSEWLFLETENLDQKIYLWNMLNQNVIPFDKNEQSQNRIRINMKDLPAGVYILETQLGKFKILKQD